MKTKVIEELFEFLNLTDSRSVRLWCEKNDVMVIKQGKSEFVFETEFQLAYEKPFINKLKKKFGDEWSNVYQLYKDGNIPALDTLFHSTTEPMPIYRSNSETKTKFINKIKDYEKKNVA